MKFSDLDTSASKKAKRAGRGISAGRGKTAGRGTKGQNSRKSGGVRPGFEGGQMPLYMRIPKLRGFTSHRPKATVVYTGDLEKLGKPTVSADVLAEAGLVENPYLKVKLVVKGDIKKKLTVKLQAASAPAIAMLQKAGGSFEKVDQQKRPVTSDKKLNKS